MLGSEPFFHYDTFGRQAKNVKPAIAHKPEVGGRGNCKARVEVWRVLDSIAIEALGAELKHAGACIVGGTVTRYLSSWHKHFLYLMFRG